jgi:hypothetical protein
MPTLALIPFGDVEGDGGECVAELLAELPVTPPYPCNERPESCDRLYSDL